MEQPATALSEQQACLGRFRDQVQQASAQGTPLRIRGGDSKHWYGHASPGEALDARAYRGIIAYDPTELVITAACGTPLAEVEAVLAERRQMLAFEPPHFNSDATIGGVVASGLSGPRRASAGAVRDFMLGAVLMDGRGDILRFGGQVMKNVAGYDVSRLLAGSLGTLGLILEVSLKVLPIPQQEISLRFSFSQADALTRLNQWGGQPLPISASAWEEDVLTLRLSGSEAAIAAARKRLGGDEVADGTAYWLGLREQQHPFFSDAEPLWRLSVPSTTAPLELQGAQLIEWGGAQRWLKTQLDAETIRAKAQAAGGHATLFRSVDNSVPVFHPLAKSVTQIHRRLKSGFDPAGIFNRGRMYPDF